MSWLDCLFWCLKVRLDGTEFNISHLLYHPFLHTNSQKQQKSAPSPGRMKEEQPSIIILVATPPSPPPSSQALVINVCCHSLIFTHVICNCESAKFNWETCWLYESWESDMMIFKTIISWNGKVEMLCNKAMN